LLEVFLACCDQALDTITLNWSNKKSLCIVVCSKGYPDKFKKDIEIKNLEEINLKTNDYLFYAGTQKKNEKIFAIGGRVLNFVSLSNDFTLAKDNVIKNINKLNWPDGFYRKDIGYKVIK